MFKSNLLRKFPYYMMILISILITNSCTRKKEGGSLLNGNRRSRTQKIMVSFVLGKAGVFSKSLNKWKVLKVGTVLSYDDVIKTGEKSQLRLQTENGSLISIYSYSQVELKSLLDKKDNSEKTEINIKTGKALLKPRKIGAISRFIIRTPAMVAGVRGTTFLVEHKAGFSNVLVEEGSVLIKPNSKSKIYQSIEKDVPSLELKQNQKASLSVSKSEQMSKRILSNVKNKKLSYQNLDIKQAPIKELSEEEKANLKTESQKLKKVNINVGELNEGENQSLSSYPDKHEAVLASLTVNSFGSSIYVNQEKVAEDYYSSLYQKGSNLLVEIKKQGKTLYNKSLIMSEKGIILKLSNSNQIEEYLKKLNPEKSGFSLFQKIPNIDFRTVKDIIIANGKTFLISHNKLRAYSQNSPKPEFELKLNPNVKPFISPNAIFTADSNGNFTAYTLSGKLLATYPLGALPFKTEISFFQNTAFLANASGSVLGLNKKGEKVFQFKAKESVLAPVIGNKMLKIIASVYNLYIFKNNRLTKTIPLSYKILKKILLFEDKIVIAKSNQIIITNLLGKTITKINANGELIYTNDDHLLIKNKNSLKLYNIHNTSIIKEFYATIWTHSDKGIFYIKNEKLIYFNFSKEKEYKLPEKEIRFIKADQQKLWIYCKTSNLYKLSIEN